ncbi:MAG TPA: flagellar basal body rod C-terminal domain-containing protein [Acidimicrobiales bacterium]|nr:flagellar basal body rod C-terminal domain-containing protein [Acidimicrobiales bacterium]
MSLFGVLPISGSGIDVMQTWLDSISGNIANMNDGVNPAGNAYEPQYIFMVPTPGNPTTGNINDQVGQGVQVGAVEYSTSTLLAYQPGNPQAATQAQVTEGAVPQGEQGMVKYPDVDLGSQLVDSVMAERTYQGNVDVINRATSAYQSAMTIGG